MAYGASLQTRVVPKSRTFSGLPRMPACLTLKSRMSAMHRPGAAQSSSFLLRAGRLGSPHTCFRPNSCC
ncbi:Pancreatic Lipase-Related Protein 3 [Manis pentadactyla]|nr:Pancreatic Lipase-Related Protein 3 [Manis pentadactyla]